MAAMGLALLLILLVLIAQFNSFRDPLVILAGSVPLAMFGAMTFVFLGFTGPPGLHFGLTEGWTTTLDIYSQAALVGLISKNAILIVEFTNVQQRAGLPKVEVVQAAASTRLRPILVTTTATVAGHFPLTFLTGPDVTLPLRAHREGQRAERERAANTEDDEARGEPRPAQAE